MAALCKAPTKSAGIGLSIMTVCKNAGKKTLGQDDFFVVPVQHVMPHYLTFRTMHHHHRLCSRGLVLLDAWWVILKMK